MTTGGRRLCCGLASRDEAVAEFANLAMLGYAFLAMMCLSRDLKDVPISRWPKLDNFDCISTIKVIISVII